MPPPPGLGAAHLGGTVPRGGQPGREPRRVEVAWAELGSLRADQPDDLERIVRAVDDSDSSRRQVAAVLLGDGPLAAAVPQWTRLLEDPSRSVRRATVDAMADVSRAELRPLLERALDDPDAWVRWKALRGIAAIGVGPSRSRVAALAADPDFRVRLDAARIS